MMRRDDKIKKVDELKKLIADHRTVGVLNMAKVPARQFLKIKNTITADGSVKIRMARKGLLVRALIGAGKTEFSQLVENLPNSPALMFSNLDPFRLFAILKKNRATSAAKTGAIVTKDVVILKGPTQMPPGPAISTLGKVGLKTRVEGGKIAIADDKTVLKAGHEVTGDLAAIFSLLKIEPVEVVLKLAAALEGGMIYGGDVLDVDTEQYMRDITLAVQSAINLSLNAGYITNLTAPLAIQLAFWQAKSLCLSANVLEADIIGEVLAKAVAEAKALEPKAPTASVATEAAQAPTT
ncbi:MAG: 50S ribosomal protein L10 [Candidatus Micrarchaeota archaeon]